jgi:hypothetical protein
MTRYRAGGRRPRSGTPGARGLALAMLALGVTACDFPTAPPIFESRFLIPESGTTLGVEQFLPSGVAVVGSSFRVTVSPVSLGRTLGQMCGQPCLAAAGQTVAKPAFSDLFTTSLALPADVPAGVLTGGTVTVNMSHSLGFDLLRPQGRTEDGRITITISSAGRTLGSALIDREFRSGGAGMISQSIPLAPGPIAGTITVELAVVSPAGSAVTINPESSVAMTVTTGNILAGEATVRVQNRQVATTPVVVDLTSIDDEVAERVRRGAVILNMSNPFDATGTLQLQFEGAAVAPRPVQVAPGESSQRIEFSEAEVRALMGRRVTLRISGPVSGAGQGGTMVIRPDQQARVVTLLDLILAIGG